MNIKRFHLLIISCILFSSCKVKKTNPIEKATMENLEPTTNKTSEEVLQYGMFIASKTVPCQGVGLQECMLVRASWETVWTNFYDTIEGFNYESGYEYHIEVKRTTLKNIPADASAFRYQLVNLLKKEKKDSDIRLEYEKSTFEGTWNLKELNGKKVSKYNAKIIFDTTSSFYADSGCNSTTKTFFSLEKNKEIILDNDYPMGSTRMGCPEGHIENEYFKTLITLKKYKETSHLLHFFDKNNSLILVFER